MTETWLVHNMLYFSNCFGCGEKDHMFYGTIDEITSEGVIIWLYRCERCFIKMFGGL